MPRQAGAKASRSAIRRGVPSAEIPEEAIRAGVSTLNAHVSDEYRILPDEDIVRMIFHAMLAKCRHLVS